MKLYSLKVVGIGPFARPVEIDFRVFDDAGLFLLRGATGSGKTTLLDAIVFALYGNVTKDGKNSEDRLRSHYISDRDQAQVELVFGTQSGVYRVLREPSFQKEGRSSRTASKASLCEVAITADGRFEHHKDIASGARDVTTEIISLVGLNREQFLQTIILPQGRFAEFLSASSQDRQLILQSIFGTARFQEYQRRLVDQAKAAQASISGLHTAQASAYEAAYVAFRSLDDDLKMLTCDSASSEVSEDASDSERLSSFPQIDDLSSESERLSEALSATEKAFADAVARSLEDLQNARSSDAQAQERLRLSIEHSDLQKKAADLSQQSEKMQELADSLQEAKRSEPLRLPLTQAEDAWSALSQEHHTAVTRLHTVQDFIADHSTLSDVESELNTRIAHLLEEKGKLLPFLDLEKKVGNIRLELEGKTKDLESLHTKVSTLHRRHEELPLLIQQIVENYTENLNRSLSHDGLTERVENLRERISHAEHAEKLAAQMTTEESAHDTLARQSQQADDYVSLLRTRWLNDAAVSLATQLRENEPCSVCGSLTHPNPAQPSEDTEPVSREDVERAQQASLEADQKLKDSHKRLSRLREDLTAYQAKAQGTLDELKARLSEAEIDLATCCQALRALPQLREDKEQLETEAKDLNSQLGALRAQESSLEGHISALRTNVAQDEEQLRNILGDHHSVQSRMDQCSAALERSQNAHTALTSYRSAVEQWDTARHRLGLILHKGCDHDHATEWDDTSWMRFTAPLPAGDFAAEVIPTLIDSHSVRLLHNMLEHLSPPQEITSREEELFAYHLSVQTTREALADTKFEALTGDESDIAHRTSHELLSCQAAYETAVQRSGSISAACQSAKRSLTHFAEATQAVSAAHEDSQAILRLAQLASGDSKANLAGIPLATWVLISLFDEVLVAANHHLQGISSGRYELIRDSLAADKRSLHGLDVMILDYDVDRQRYPATLSGGETFYVSLSLALGLAEIVSGENGGIELQSMFIDEGFGTLDPHTLDIVMEVLHDLHNHNRLIGVISHVEDLSKRIPEQILVEKMGEGGSSVTIRA